MADHGDFITQMWKGLSVLTNSPSPIVVVLSGSMEPAFQRGDLLFLRNNQPMLNVGEIVVYQVKDKEIPIVHRVVRQFGDEWVFLPSFVSFFRVSAALISGVGGTVRICSRVEVEMS